MCGIFGIINKSGREINVNELLAARDLVDHRGPDGAGIWHSNNVGFGHRRLAVLGIGDKGNQPFAYRHLTVIHNGEIYNYLEIRDLLKKLGYQFETGTDTEVIAASYCHWGMACVEQFNGIWAFAIHDAHEKMVFCSRDRFGVKPFYFSSIGNQFCFASEIKQFKAINGWSASPNLARCEDYLNHGLLDHTDETLFEGVKQLPAGHNLLFDLKKNTFGFTAYYQLSEKLHPVKLSEHEAIEQYTALLLDSVNLQLRSDVPIGLTLSGGLDSSTLAGIIAEKHQGLACFSACFHEKGFNEQRYLDAVTNKHQLSTSKIYPSHQDLEKAFAATTYAMDEPLPTASDITHYLVFQKEKMAGITVNLCGQGADEALAGYDAFFPKYWRSLWPNRPFRFAMELGGFALKHPQTIKKRLSKSHKIGKTDSIFSNFAHQQRLSRVQNASLQFIESSVLPYILHSEDRLSMAHGIE
ncbi:MAG: asparagine synthase (glutamine-hydrolyzing), partial [Saprospiraceae bacterium]|nr:asparagine synthase (glutamine-hydrolyzing) [Saprospiraceae bacterium]